MSVANSARRSPQPNESLFPKQRALERVLPAFKKTAKGRQAPFDGPGLCRGLYDGLPPAGARYCLAAARSKSTFQGGAAVWVEAV